MVWLLLITGFLGGILRGLVGFIKHQFSYRDTDFKLFYFFGMMFLSGIVGMLAALSINESPTFSFIVGYAGGDFLESIYKIAIKSSSFKTE